MSISTLDPAATELLTDPSGRVAPPGIVLAIAEGDTVHTAAAGLSDVDSAEPATAAHAQDIGSVGKVLTTLAVLALVGRGGLALDTDLRRLLGTRSGGHADATVEDLLRHRAGLRPWWPLYLEAGAAEDPIAFALSLPAGAPRDTSRQYSDLGMLVLGEVVERVTGLPFVTAVQHLVLAPARCVTVTPAHPAAHLLALSGPDGDEIEREMVRSGHPYPVTPGGSDFPWRTGRLSRDIADGNAFHVFGGTAGHAGWFSDVSGLLQVATVLADPDSIGIDEATRRTMSISRDDGQSLGVRRYTVRWRGRDRDVLGHPGFTGAFVGTSAAVDGEPTLRVALLANRLHGVPAPARDRLVDVESLWRRAIASADALNTPITSGE
jgi:CubicO group peptidase (beta-lactamase class C family)